jgi:hypothetical protein
MKSTSSLATSKPPRLRVGLKDVSPDEFSTALHAHLGKQRVSIMLDGAILAFLKPRRGSVDINQALHQAMISLVGCAMRARQAINRAHGVPYNKTQKASWANSHAR